MCIKIYIYIYIYGVIVQEGGQREVGDEREEVGGGVGVGGAKGMPLRAVMRRIWERKCSPEFGVVVLTGVYSVAMTELFLRTLRVCVAVRCSALQIVAVRCRLLQCGCVGCNWLP